MFDGDTVKIKGKRGKSTVATVAAVSDSDVSTLTSASLGIAMSSDAMKVCEITYRNHYSCL